MKYAQIASDYNYDTNDINIYCRDEDNKKVTRIVHGFPPYGYASADNKDDLLSIRQVTSVEETDIPHVDDLGPMVKFTTESPKYVGQIRKESVYPVYEADIPFPRRFQIDHKILSGFETDGSQEILHPDDLKPVSFTITPRVAYIDIETRIKEKKNTINCIYDSYTSKYISIALDPKGRRKGKEVIASDHMVIFVPTEKELIETTKSVLLKINPDVLTAWYIDFDLGYLNDRSKHFTGKEFNLSQTNVFDLLEPYKKLYNKGSNKLKDVVVTEDLQVPNYEPFQQKFWEKDLDKAIIVNKSHVESIVRLDKKLEIIETYWNFKNISGFDSLQPTLYHGSIIDMLLLRNYHNKYILNSRPSTEIRHERDTQMKIEKVGGKVFDPPYGRFENIAVMDASRYYPELIIAQNLTFERVEDGTIGVLSQMTLDLIEERLKYDARLDKLEPGTAEHKRVKYLRDTIKFILNSIFGYCGWSGARCFDLTVFNRITNMGQKGLLFLQDKSKEDGNDVIYGDTDSIFLIMPNDKLAKEMVLPQCNKQIQSLINNGISIDNIHTMCYTINYAETLNNYLKEFSSENGFDRNLELKLDRFFSTILFKKVRERVGGRWIERGAKKRYVGNVCFDSGQPVNYLKIVGFEYVRKDAAPITKDVQPNVFGFILDGKLDKLGTYIRTTVNEIREKFKDGVLSPNEIAIPTTLSKNPEDYGGKDKNGRKLTPPDYVRGAIFSNDWLGEDIQASDQIHMLYVKKLPSYPPTDIISYTDESVLPPDLEIDIEKHIDRTLRMPLEKVIGSVDMSWKDIFMPKRKLW